jgi:hypothetical protein
LARHARPDETICKFGVTTVASRYALSRVWCGSARVGIYLRLVGQPGPQPCRLPGGARPARTRRTWRKLHIRAVLHGPERGRSLPTRIQGQAMRTEIERLSSSMRLSVWTATSISVARRDCVCTVQQTLSVRSSLLTVTASRRTLDVQIPSFGSAL